MLGFNTLEVRRKDIQAMVSYSFTHPVLALGRSTISCAGQCLDSSVKCKKKNSSHFANRKRMVIIKYYTHYSRTFVTWEGGEDRGAWLREERIY